MTGWLVSTQPVPVSTLLILFFFVSSNSSDEMEKPDFSKTQTAAVIKSSDDAASRRNSRISGCAWNRIKRSGPVDRRGGVDGGWGGCGFPEVGGTCGSGGSVCIQNTSQRGHAHCAEPS